MPETRTYSTESALQGYPDVGDSQKERLLLKADRELLLKIYAKESERDDPDAITKLEVGKLCQAFHGVVKKKVINACSSKDGRIYKLFDKYQERRKNLPPSPVNVNEKDINLGDVTFTMGPLKKVPRILEKAVSYAVCTKDEDEADPKLERVVDILRGTLVFENEDLLLYQPDDGSKCIASQIIDAFHDEFGGQLVQVKNRFMNRRQPILHTFYTQNFMTALNKEANHKPIEVSMDEDELADATIVNTIATMVNCEMKGRDAFYRDLQLLIKLPVDKYKNDLNIATQLSHVYFELQITTRKLMAAKAGKSGKNAPSGHDQYKQVRRVMEYCEYLYWTWKKKGASSTFKFKMSDALLEEFFPGPVKADYATFEETIVAMWDKYKANSPQGARLKTIANAIDNSKWYSGK